VIESLGQPTLPPQNACHLEGRQRVPVVDGIVLEPARFEVEVGQIVAVLRSAAGELDRLLVVLAGCLVVTSLMGEDAEAKEGFRIRRIHACRLGVPGRRRIELIAATASLPSAVRLTVQMVEGVGTLQTFVPC